MSKGKLFFTVSPPRAGKSSYADCWVKNPGVTFTTEWDGNLLVKRERVVKVDPIARPRVVLSGDSFRRAVSGHEYNYVSEGLVFATMDVACRALLISGFDVLIDDTNTTEATIKRYLRIDINAEPIFIFEGADVCKERARLTGKEYLCPVIDLHAEAFKALWEGYPANVEKWREEILFRQSISTTI